MSNKTNFYIKAFLLLNATIQFLFGLKNAPFYILLVIGFICLVTFLAASLLFGNITQGLNIIAKFITCADLKFHQKAVKYIFWVGITAGFICSVIGTYAYFFAEAHQHTLLFISMLGAIFAISAIENSGHTHS